METWIEKWDVFLWMGLAIIVACGLSGWLYCTDLRDHEADVAAGRTGPDQARRWAEKYGADGPIDCIDDGNHIYRCTTAKKGSLIALECRPGGCILVR